MRREISRLREDLRLLRHHQTATSSSRDDIDTLPEYRKLGSHHSSSYDIADAYNDNYGERYGDHCSICDDNGDRYRKQYSRFDATINDDHLQLRRSKTAIDGEIMVDYIGV